MSPTTREPRQVTQDLSIHQFALSSDGQWAILQGYPVYGLDVEKPQQQQWLLQLDSGRLFRVPLEVRPIRLLGWSPGEGQWLTVTNTNEATELVLITANDFTTRRMVFPAGSRFLIGPVR